MRGSRKPVTRERKTWECRKEERQIKVRKEKRERNKRARAREIEREGVREMRK